MRLYRVGDRTVLLVNGDLYEQLPPLRELTDAASAPERARKRGRPPGPRDSFAEVQRQIKRRKVRKTLAPEMEDTIKTEIERGLGLVEACKRYSISVSTYYRLKGDLRNRPIVEEDLIPQS